MLLAIGLIGAAWPAIVSASVITVMIRWVVRDGERAKARRLARVREHAAIAARADEQQRLIIAGDPRGIYGEWPPANGIPHPPFGEGINDECPVPPSS